MKRLAVRLLTSTALLFVGTEVLWSDPLLEPLPLQTVQNQKKAALGRALFFDPILSRDGTISCAHCHDLENGGDDGRPRSVGIEGRLGTLNISASIGVALYPDNGENIMELIKNADNAMYLAKSMGKNNFQFFVPELSRRMHRRLEIEQGLNKALKNGEFWLAFQPQYHLDDHSLYGAEALLRWESEELGIVAPDEFIPVAEETGMINAIGKFVFEEACKTLARLDAEGFSLDNIAVNVSSKQFTEKGLPEFFTDTVARYGLTPARITLEITERYIMDTSAYDDKLLDTFKELGFGISVDDFGTGYSSMSYLKKLPIDTIKIDKSFIRDIPHDTSDNEITKAIIVLSGSLGYKTVAEGIENAEQEHFLLEHGCHYGQGYHFSRPLPFDEFVDFVRSRAKEEEKAAL
ncbi:EAL domain-containing protein [Hydrogenimonas sp.]